MIADSSNFKNDVASDGKRGKYRARGKLQTARVYHVLVRVVGIRVELRYVRCDGGKTNE